MEKENEESQLEEVVERNKVENESCELVDNVEEAVDNPVRKPLCVFSFISGLKSQETHESGIGDGKETGDVAGSNT